MTTSLLRNPSVVVIGAGMTGILLAIELEKAGITDVTILEKKTIWEELGEKTPIPVLLAIFLLICILTVLNRIRNGAIVLPMETKSKLTSNESVKNTKSHPKSISMKPFQRHRITMENGQQKQIKEKHTYPIF